MSGKYNRPHPMRGKSNYKAKLAARKLRGSDVEMPSVERLRSRQASGRAVASLNPADLPKVGREGRRPAPVWQDAPS